MVHDRIAEELEAKGFYRRAAARWGEVMQLVETDKERHQVPDMGIHISGNIHQLRFYKLNTRENPTLNCAFFQQIILVIRLVIRFKS